LPPYRHSAQLEHGAYRDRENHIHRVLDDDGGQRPVGRANDIADGDGCLADLAIDRRRNRRIAQVDLGEFQTGLGSQQLALEIALGGFGRIDRRLLAGRRVEQRLGALQHNIGIHRLRLNLVDRPLLSLHIGLEGQLFEAVEHIARLDLLALLKDDLIEKGRHAGHDVVALRRLDAPDESIGHDDRCFLCFDDADSRWRSSGRLSPSRAGLEESSKPQESSQADHQDLVTRTNQRFPGSGF
jgi:hypothetical protein